MSHYIPPLLLLYIMFRVTWSYFTITISFTRVFFVRAFYLRAGIVFINNNYRVSSRFSSNNNNIIILKPPRLNLPLFPFACFDHHIVGAGVVVKKQCKTMPTLSVISYLYSCHPISTKGSISSVYSCIALTNHQRTGPDKGQDMSRPAQSPKMPYHNN